MNPQNPSTAGPSNSQAPPSTTLQRTRGRRPLLDDDKRRQILAILANGSSRIVSPRRLRWERELDGLGADFSTPAVSIDANAHSELRAQVQDLPKLAAAPLAEVNLNTTKVR